MLELLRPFGRKPRPFQADAARRPQLQVSRILAHQVGDQTGARFLKIAGARASQNSIQPAMEAPRPLVASAARCAPRLAINTTKIPYILWRNTELLDHRREFVLQ